MESLIPYVSMTRTFPGFTSAMRRVLRLRLELKLTLQDILLSALGAAALETRTLVNGLYDCYRNRVPVLAIAAHIPIREIGRTFRRLTRSFCSGSAVNIVS